jgi:hypothetical protein
VAAYLNDAILDGGLTILDTLGDKLTICSQQPTTYTEGNATYALGNKTSLSIGAPADNGSNGRKVTVGAITGGSVTGTNTATHWAILDTTNSRLLASHTLSASQAVTNGNTFSLAAFDIAIPDPA